MQRSAIDRDVENRGRMVAETRSYLEAHARCQVAGCGERARAVLRSGSPMQMRALCPRHAKSNAIPQVQPRSAAARSAAGSIVGSCPDHMAARRQRMDEAYRRRRDQG